MDTDDLKALLLVLEHGSFQAAAEASKQPRSSLRRRVENLEAELGPLLIRQNTGIAATPTGRVVATRGRLIVQDVTTLTAAVRRMDTELIVRAPVGLPPHIMTLALSLVRERLPHIRINWQICENPAFASGETPDLILHFGPPPGSGAWISTTLFRAPERLVASADYVAEKGLPESLEELSQHPLLRWKPPWGEAELLPLRAGGEHRVAPVFVSTDVHLVRCLALAGQGIAYVPDGGVPEVDQNVELLPVLAPIVGRDQALRALVPTSLSTLPTGQRLLDVLRELSALLPS